MFSTFLFWIFLNSAKYTYGWLPLEKHHKCFIKKLKKKKKPIGRECEGSSID
jgi:hypothetical protein